MQMQFDFYSKNELSILVDYSGRYPFPETVRNDLFLFCCFTLRQLQILGQHLVAKTLAGALVSGEQVKGIYQDEGDYFLCSNLLKELQYYALSRIAKAMDPNSYAKHAVTIMRELTYEDHLLKLVDTDILGTIPTIVGNRGKGKRGFTVSVPPFSLKLYGFGALGVDANHHAFHSVFSLIKYFGSKYQVDERFAEYLVNAARVCGGRYILKQIPVDIVVTANQILDQVGVE